MADRIIYLGPFNNNKKQELIEKSLKSLANKEGHRFYYLLPNGELLTYYRKKFIKAVKSAFEINLYTFDNIVNNILKEKIYLTINEATKDIIIKTVVKELEEKGKISYYKDFISMEGFIESVNAIIGEIKRSLIDPKIYLENSPDSLYHKEIGFIYEEYENLLNRLNLIDREGSYFKAIEILRSNTDDFKDIDYIIIDEFYDFRPIEIEIIKELCKYPIDIYINIPFDMRNRLSNIDNTLKLLKELGFQEEYIEKTIENPFESISSNFFNDEIPRLEYNENLVLIKSPSIYLEFKRIFQEIKTLYKEGKRLDQMAIILLSDNYQHFLQEVSKEEKTPISLNTIKPLIEIPLIKEFINLIEAKISNISKQSLINRVKSNYFDIVDEEIRHGMEFVLRKLDFNNLNQLINLFEDEKTLNISMDYLEPVLALIATIKDEIKEISDKDSIINYNNSFVKILNDYNIKEKIHNRYLDSKDYNLFHRDLTALEKLIDIINNTSQIALIVDDISIEDYYDAIIRLIQSESIVLEEGNMEGVKILNPINSRGFIYDIVFITGLTSTNYPKVNETNFLINDENHSQLKRIGINHNNYHDRLNNEAIKFASLVSSSKERLYLSYSDSSDENNIPSIFLDEIVNMFDGEKLEDKLPNIKIDLDYLYKDGFHNLTTEQELTNYLILNHYNDLSKESMDYFALHNNLNNKILNIISNKNLSQYKRQEKEFNKYSGYINEEEITKDIKDLHQDFKYSNTYLESYGRCPYYFMLNNLLKVRDMEREFQEYSPMDTGKIYHEVLNRYYKNYKDEIRSDLLEDRKFAFEDSLDYLKEITFDCSIELGFDPKDRASILIIENSLSILKDFIQKDIERLFDKRESLVPYDFEVSFGFDKDFIMNIGGKEIKLRGKIDRIDKHLNEEKYIVIDYKSSSYGIYDINNMKEGVSLQLPIYALSQENKNIVAGVYGIISNGEFELKIGKLEESKIVTKRHAGALDLEGWNDLMNLTKSNIKNIVDGIHKGDFSVNPKECSEYCIYKEICRYEDILEVE